MRWRADSRRVVEELGAEGLLHIPEEPSGTLCTQTKSSIAPRGVPADRVVSRLATAAASPPATAQTVWHSARLSLHSPSRRVVEWTAPVFARPSWGRAAALRLRPPPLEASAKRLRVCCFGPPEEALRSALGLRPSHLVAGAPPRPQLGIPFVANERRRLRALPLHSTRIAFYQHPARRPRPPAPLRPSAKPARTHANRPRSESSAFFLRPRLKDARPTGRTCIVGLPVETLVASFNSEDPLASAAETQPHEASPARRVCLRLRRKPPCRRPPCLS